MEIGKPSSLLRVGATASRSRAGMMAAGLALLAAIVVIIAISRAGGSSAGTGVATALVADRLIPKGSSAEAAAAERALRPVEIRDDQLRPGAISDVAALRNQVAAHDVLPGQQIVAGDFAPAGDALQARLTRFQRALSIPLDAARGLAGDVKAGDHVDVLAAFAVQSDGRARPVVRVVARNVIVLRAPELDGADGSQQSVATLRVDDTTAARIAFAAENGRVWLLLRPPAGAADSPARSVDIDALLFGSRPIPTEGGR